jgi:hypothetical protein
MRAIGRPPARIQRQRRAECSFPARLLVCSAVLVSSFGAIGCGNVASYERGKLAHPTMSPAHAGSPAREHVYAVQEGAMGGNGQAASGCGCN